MTKRAVLYARVSGDDRDMGGRNLESQVEMCRHHALQKGWHIVAELPESEKGASGADLDLPQLNKALGMARENLFDVLIVREIDRLARSLAKQLIVEGEFSRLGVSIEYVIGNYDNTAEGSLMKNVRAVVAEYERLKTTERMTRGKRREVKRGSVLVAHLVPYGYHKVREGDKFMLEIREDEARVIRLIFEWYTGEEKMTVTDIAGKLTAMGVPTWHDNRKIGRKKRKRGEWGRSSVYYILNNETYAGTWHYGKANKRKGTKNDQEHWISIQVPAIISMQMWKQAKKQLDANRHLNPRKNRKYDYLIGRRVRCGSCNYKMQSSTSHGYGYYRCEASIRRKKRYDKKCKMPSFRADDVDPAVWQWVRSLFVDGASLKQNFDDYRKQQSEFQRPSLDKLEVINDLLSDYKGQLEELLDLYLKGDFNRNILLERKQRLEDTIKGLKREKLVVEASLKVHMLTEEQITNIQAFADDVRNGLLETDEDFETRRQLIDWLDLTATLVIENDERFIDVECVLGKERIRTMSSSTRDEPPIRSLGRATRVRMS